MDKATILSELTQKGQVTSFRRTPEWEKAFDAYNKANPNNKRKVGCGSCFRDVLAWLRS